MVWKFANFKNQFLHIIIQKQLSVLFINAKSCLFPFSWKAAAIVNCWLLAAQLRWGSDVGEPSLPLWRSPLISVFWGQAAGSLTPVRRVSILPFRPRRYSYPGLKRICMESLLLTVFEFVPPVDLLGGVLRVGLWLIHSLLTLKGSIDAVLHRNRQLKS